MNETQIHQESEEISDSTSFSAVAVIGFFFSLVGIFSIAYMQTLPVGILGSLMGAFVLLTASRYRLNGFSRVLGFLALTVGVVSISWGMFQRQLSTDSDMQQARRIAELYLASLSADDLDKVYYLVGFQFEPESPDTESDSGTPGAVMVKAKNRLATDPAHVEIRTRKTPAKWTFVSLDGETTGSVGYSYRLRFRDDGQTIPPSYWIYARKDCDKYDIQEKVHWYVDSLERAK